MKKFNLHAEEHKAFNNYYQAERVTKKDSYNKIPFTIYWLVKTITTEQKTMLLKKYKNISFGQSVSEYAPEQKRQVIFVYDKNLI